MSFADPPPPPPSGSTDANGSPVFTLSHWGRRAAASLIDGMIVYLIAEVGLILGGGKRYGLVNTIFSLIAIGFSIWQLVRQGRSGQTIGKRVLDIKLVGEATAEPIGPLKSIGRSILHLIDLLPCLVGYLFPLWDAKRQTFADKIVRTVVIDS